MKKLMTMAMVLLLVLFSTSSIRAESYTDQVKQELKAMEKIQSQLPANQKEFAEVVDSLKAQVKNGVTDTDTTLEMAKMVRTSSEVLIAIVSRKSETVLEKANEFLGATKLADRKVDILMENAKEGSIQFEKAKFLRMLTLKTAIAVMKMLNAYFGDFDDLFKHVLNSKEALG